MSGFTHDDVLTPLENALERPLTAPGSAALAREVLDQFADLRPQVMSRFADKVLQTLADGERHDTVAVAPSLDIAIWFVVWPSSYVEVQIDRIGKYLDQLGRTATFLIESGVQIEAILQIDVYATVARSAGTGADRASNLRIEVEYSFAPGELFGSTRQARARWRSILLNFDLLTQAEKGVLESFAG